MTSFFSLIGHFFEQQTGCVCRIMGLTTPGLYSIDPYFFTLFHELYQIKCIQLYEFTTNSLENNFFFNPITKIHDLCYLDLNFELPSNITQQFHQLKIFQKFENLHEFEKMQHYNQQISFQPYVTDFYTPNSNIGLKVFQQTKSVLEPASLSNLD